MVVRSVLAKRESDPVHTVKAVQMVASSTFSDSFQQHQI